MAAATIAGLFLLASLPFVLIDYNRGSGEQGLNIYYINQNLYHLKAVRLFSQQLPRLDFADYPSATTPLYHVLLASVDRWISQDIRVLRLANALLTAGFLATVAAAIARENRLSVTLALCLPLICSWYIFACGVWLEPVNLGWWGVAVILILALRDRLDRWTYVGGGIALLLLVLTRQIHIWAGAVLWLTAWLGTRSGSARERSQRGAWMVLATLPAFAALAYFVWLWGGATPPSFQEEHGRMNPAIPAMVLAILGIAGTLLCTVVWPEIPELLKQRRTWSILALGLLVGLVIGVVPHTSYSVEEGRRSGLWNIALRLPTIADRSPLMIVLATLGGGIVAMYWLLLSRRDRLIFLGALAAFTAANTMNFWAYQRYYEPFALLLLALMTGRIASRSASTSPPLTRLLGPIALAGLLAMVTIQNMT